jgi:hypothetical protein
MGSFATIYVPSFVKIGSGIKNLIVEDTQTARWSQVLFYFIFLNKGSTNIMFLDIVHLSVFIENTVLRQNPVSETLCFEI